MLIFRIAESAMRSCGPVLSGLGSNCLGTNCNESKVISTADRAMSWLWPGRPRPLDTSSIGRNAVGTRAGCDRNAADRRSIDQGRSSEIVGQPHRLPTHVRQAERLPYNSLLTCQLAKIRDDVWLEIEVPNRCATEQSTIDNRAPHDCAMNQVQCTENGCVNNNQAEDRNDYMT